MGQTQLHNSYDKNMKVPKLPKGTKLNMNPPKPISLYVIIDNNGRILYTDCNKKDIDIIKENLYNDCKVIILKGEY